MRCLDKLGEMYVCIYIKLCTFSCTRIADQSGIVDVNRDHQLSKIMQRGDRFKRNNSSLEVLFHFQKNENHSFNFTFFFIWVPDAIWSQFTTTGSNLISVSHLESNWILCRFRKFMWTDIRSSTRKEEGKNRNRWNILPGVN